MSNVPFAIELREKFGLTQETSDEQMAEYLELSIQRLKGHLIDMAAMKKVEFSIFFRKPQFVTFECHRVKYQPPPNAYVMPLDTKKAVVKFLTEEGFYFDEWSEHIAINLVKSPKA